MTTGGSGLDNWGVDYPVYMCGKFGQAGVKFKVGPGSGRMMYYICRSLGGQLLRKLQSF